MPAAARGPVVGPTQGSRPLSNSHTIAAAARAIEPLLNRVVFTGRQVADYLITASLATAPKSTVVGDAPLRLLCSASLDRVAADLSRLGLTRKARTVASERWVIADGPTIDLIHVSSDANAVEGDANGALSTWLEYATLLTMGVQVGPGPTRMAVRISGAPALLALDWAAYRSSKASPLDSLELADIITLVAGRTELAAELRAAPPELREFVRTMTHRFLEYDGADQVIQRALPSAFRGAAMVARIGDRLRAMTQ
jgi:hypothetical protein